MNDFFIWTRPVLPGALAGLLTCLLAGPDTKAARISEPSTVFYGRIVERVGGREFPIAAGRLVWNLRTLSPVEREYQLTTQLGSMADGRFSYRLSIPHEVLGYDLAVNPKTVGLARTSGSLRHVSVTLDGKPLIVEATAVPGFAIDQTRRATALRIDLVLQGNSMDQDGDGAPDWWEDQNGLDKFDPTDAPQGRPGQELSSDRSTRSESSEAQTLAGWRSIWFPGSTGDLDSFGQEDADHDGIPNLLEYAFDLDPTQPELTRSTALPRAFTNGARSGVSFQKRAGTTDLVYTVEASFDLLHWESGPDLVQESSAAGSNVSEFTAVSDPAESHRFYRVRVNRK